MSSFPGMMQESKNRTEILRQLRNDLTQDQKLYGQCLLPIALPTASTKRAEMLQEVRQRLHNLLPEENEYQYYFDDESDGDILSDDSFLKAPPQPMLSHQHSRLGDETPAHETARSKLPRCLPQSAHSAAAAARSKNSKNVKKCC